MPGLRPVRATPWATALIALSLLAGCAGGQRSSAELATRSDQTDFEKRAAIRLQLALEYYEQKQLAVALDEIKQALRTNPEFSDAYNVRALIYMDMGETQLAEENFLQAIKLAPTNPDLSNNFGWFLCQNGRPEQSIAYFEATLKNRSYQSPSKALNNAGACSLKMRDYGNAERYLLQSFQLDPSSVSTNINLSRLFYARNDFSRARFYIERAVKADVMTAEVLWLAIKIDHKLDDKIGETGMATQLRRRHPNSTEYSMYQRGAYDE